MKFLSANRALIHLKSHKPEYYKSSLNLTYKPEIKISLR